MNLTADTINIPELQFVDLGLSTINALGKGSSPWTPATIVGRPMDIAHRSAPDHIFENNKSIRDNTSVKSDYNSKTSFEIWRENQEFERQKNARS